MIEEKNGLFKSMDAVFSTLDYIDDQMENSGLNVEKCNNINLDFLHILETYNLNDRQLLNVAKAIVANQKRRRDYKNQYIIAKTYRENKSKLSSKEGRKVFKDSILDTVSHLGERYKLKVLSEEDVEKIINKAIPVRVSDEGETSKGHKRGDIPSKNKLQQVLSELKTAGKVAKHFGVSIATINKWKRDYGLVRSYKRRA